MDEPSLSFLKRAIEVQCAYREAFASHDVQPLVPTEVSGVFANVFRTQERNVWTLYNANGRSVRGTVLQTQHIPGASYRDAWHAAALNPEVRDGVARLPLELDPKGIGCIVQDLP